MMTLYSVMSTIKGDTELYGKKASELGSFQLAKSGAVTGEANYVTGYTGFNGTDENEQKGYYFPIAFTQSQEVREAYMKVVGSENGPVKMDPQNVVYLGSDAAAARNKQIEITSGSNRWVLSFQGVDFKAQAKRSRSK